MTADLHQHLWPAPFVAALRARTAPPRLEGWTLQLAGGAFAVDPAAHDVLARADAPAVVSPGAALGLDRLPPAEAAALAAAWHEGAAALPAPLRAWATAGVLEPDPAALGAAIESGLVGLEVAADVLAALDGLDRLAPLLEVLDATGAALFVHPGPAPAREPAWWQPVVGDAAQLAAAWWAWTAGAGRERFPRMPVLFAALAGLAPLHAEAHRVRGGGRLAVDPMTYLDTSGHGTKAVDAVVRVLGVDVLCHGSDRPHAEAQPLRLDPSITDLIERRNPARLLTRTHEEVPA